MMQLTPISAMLARHARRHPIAYMLTVAFLLVGIVFGAMAVSRLTAGQKADLVSYLDDYIRTYDAGGERAAGDLQGPLSTQGKSLVFAYLLGLTIIGAPAVLLIMFAKGFLIGFTVAFLLEEYLARGALFALAAVLPHNAILIPATLVLCVNALAFAWGTAKGPSRTGPPLYQRFVTYSFWAATMGVLLLGASLVETYVTPVFIRLVVRYL